MYIDELNEEIELNDYEVVKREMFQPDPNQPKVILDFEKNTITVNKACIEAIGNPDYVHFLTKPGRKTLILTNWDEYRKKKDMPEGTRVEKNRNLTMDGSRLLHRITRMMGWKDMAGTRVVVHGEKYANSDALKFPLEVHRIYVRKNQGDE